MPFFQTSSNFLYQPVYNGSWQFPFISSSKTDGSDILAIYVSGTGGPGLTAAILSCSDATGTLISRSAKQSTFTQGTGLINGTLYATPIHKESGSIYAVTFNQANNQYHNTFVSISQATDRRITWSSSFQLISNLTTANAFHNSRTDYLDDGLLVGVNACQLNSDMRPTVWRVSGSNITSYALSVEATASKPLNGALSGASLVVANQPNLLVWDTSNFIIAFATASGGTKHVVVQGYNYDKVAKTFTSGTAISSSDTNFGINTIMYGIHKVDNTNNFLVAFPTTSVSDTAAIRMYSFDSASLAITTLASTASNNPAGPNAEHFKITAYTPFIYGVSYLGPNNREFAEFRFIVTTGSKFLPLSSSVILNGGSSTVQTFHHDAIKIHESRSAYILGNNNRFAYIGTWDTVNIIPSCSISALVEGSSILLTWSSSNATIVTINPTVGSSSLSGSTVIDLPTESTTFFMTASNNITDSFSSVQFIFAPPGITPAIVSQGMVASIEPGLAINLNIMTATASIGSIIRNEFPSIGDSVIRIGQTITLVWVSEDLTNINVVLYKGNTRLVITNRTSIDGRNKYTIFVDNSFFSANFLPCKIRIEMKENPNIFTESPSFKVLRQEG